MNRVCPTLFDPMDCGLPGSSIHGIFQARVLEWAAISFSKWRGGKPGRQQPPALEPPRSLAQLPEPSASFPHSLSGDFPPSLSIGGCVDAAIALVSANFGEQLGNYFQKY